MKLGEYNATMPYDARDVANLALDVCSARGWKITNLSLQKLVYFCHAWHMKLFGTPLVAEQFEAWKYGPVLPYLYREFKDFDDRPITRRASKLDKLTGARTVADYCFPSDTQELLVDTIDAYGGLSAFQLVQMSHAPGGPWDQVWNDSGLNPGMRISNDSIKAFYSASPRGEIPAQR